MTTAFSGSSRSDSSATQQHHALPSFVPSPPAFAGNASQNSPLRASNPMTSPYTPSNHAEGSSIMSIFHTAGDLPDLPPQPPQPGATSARSIQSAYITGKTVDELFEMLVFHNNLLYALTVAVSSSIITQHFHSSTPPDHLTSTITLDPFCSG